MGDEGRKILLLEVTFITKLMSLSTQWCVSIPRYPDGRWKQANFLGKNGLRVGASGPPFPQLLVLKSV